MTKDIVYLAHSVHQRERGKAIQKWLEVNLPIKVYNPFYPFDERAARGDVKALDEGVIVPWDITDKERSKWIIEIDLRAVGNANYGIFIFPNRRTVGIPCEMTVAWMLHKSVYSVCPPDMVGHPWIVGMSDEVFTNIEALYHFLWCKYGKDKETEEVPQPF